MNSSYRLWSEAVHEIVGKDRLQWSATFATDHDTDDTVQTPEDQYRALQALEVRVAISQIFAAAINRMAEIMSPNGDADRLVARLEQARSHAEHDELEATLTVELLRISADLKRAMDDKISPAPPPGLEHMPTASALRH